ncbi:MAG: HAD family hydrolase [Deltaproteobacteria bacterium]|nr:HAD family hydrolase [Deltaproteobacteria bacterium]
MTVCMIRSVVWDWNGTLLDDLHHSIAVMNDLLAVDGLRALTVERYHRLFGFPVRDYYESLGFDLSNGRWSQLAASFIERYNAGVHICDLHHGARSTLETLRERGIGSSILTAARQDSVEALLSPLGLRHLIDEVVGLGDHYATSKEAAGLDWLTRVDLDPEQALLVGDTLHDFEVSQAMGVKCILVTFGHHPPDRLRACNCPIATSYDEVNALIDDFDRRQVL